MTPQANAADRIREYLARLSPQARSHLLTEIERMQLYGEDVSGSALILAELRAEFRKGGETSNRLGNPARYFFKPMEALFVDRAPEAANAGQISRGSLAAIWEWINHELLRTMARDYNETMKAALIAGRSQEASKLAVQFQSKVIHSLQGKLASADGVKSAEHGLGQYTSSHGCITDLRKILLALQMREAIVALGEALPPKIDHFDGDTLIKVQTLLDGFVTKHPDGLSFGLSIVMKRLKRSWQIALLAIQGSYSGAAEDIAGTRYAPAVSMVLDHLDEQRWHLKQAMKANHIESAKEILSDIYGIEQQLHDRIARLDQSDWGRRLEQCMAALAADLDAEYHTIITGDVHGDLHHVLEGIERRRPGAGLLHHLWLKGRDALAGGVAYCEHLVGHDHKQAS